MKFPRDVHDWFGLSYAQYLTVPRSVLQSMSPDWQREFAALLDRLDEAFDWRPRNAQYWVSLRDRDGKYLPISRDPFMDYERGRKRWTPEGIADLEGRP